MLSSVSVTALAADVKTDVQEFKWEEVAEELDEIDSCDLCRIMPELEKTCYATAYCHRQMKMDLTE